MTPVALLVRVLSGLAIAMSVHLPGQTPATPPTYDLLLRGGTVIDGSGGEPFRADVAVADGRIAAIGELEGATAARVIDVTGQIVAPGFVDVHTHAESITSRPEAHNYVEMGVTTIVTGNCGSSAPDIASFLDHIERNGASVNVATLIGHSTVRREVLGLEQRAPTDAELTEMRGSVRKAMSAGAVGLSTGLIYVPGTYAKTDEIVALAVEVARFDGVYASHMRDEGDHVLESIDEALEIGRKAEVAVHISHLKASGKPNWGRSAAILDHLREARAGGTRVTADQYAYTASSTSLDVLYPSEELSIGPVKFSAKLRDDPAFRQRMRSALYDTMDHSGFGDLSFARIANAPGNTELNGHTIAEAAAIRHPESTRVTQATVALDLTAKAHGKRISMVYHKMSEEDVAAIMASPFVAVASDSGIRLRKSLSRPHPRGTGNNPRVLGHYARDLGVLSLPLAVRKMSALPAEIFGLRDRGIVRADAHADLVVFNAAEIDDRATYAAPTAPPVGISWVIVNGVIVVEHGEHHGTRPGDVLRHTAGKQER